MPRVTASLRASLGAVVVISFLGFAAVAQTPASALDGLHWRSVGPATTGGRIADIAVAMEPGQPQVVYVGTASGGVFKSTNAGVSWSPIFDHSGGMLSIGAVAVAPSNPSEVWVGTGEADNRQSSSWGNGVFKSLDAGATWHKMGLDDSRQIGKIVVDPNDPNTVYVAAIGHLWGSNPERGVFKTTDGGQTWKKVLYVDDNTGAIDLALSPHHPNLIFAAMYQRQRKGWGFHGGGPGSGIYRSTDAGATWTRLTQGLPSTEMGRIGLALDAADDSIVFAIVEADPAPNQGPGVPVAGGGAGAGGAPAAGGRGGRGATARELKGGVYRSLDQGQSWEHMSTIDPRPMYYGRIYVDSRDASRVYLMGSERGFFISDDAGRNFHDVFSQVHGEDHVMWIDPTDSNHFLIGGDGGVSISYDRGLTWLFRDDMPIGQFYNISTSEGDPYLICGGLQDNGNWCTASASNLSYGLSNRDAFNVGGGDGMYAVFDGDNHTLLVSSQNGSTGRLDLRDMERQSIAPAAPVNAPPPAPGSVPGGRGAGYRWYWTAPLIVSHFNPKVVYTGANELFRSDDQGVSWKAISGDLTGNVDRSKLEMMGGPIPADALSKNDGQDNFSALTAIGESPLEANVLYTGADDGTLSVTRDGGAHWTRITANVPGLPAMTNVSGIEPSRYAAGRIYATFDGHFNDDYHPYVYVSEDYGQTWKPIAEGLPMTSVHRVRENPKNPDFLVAGTEEGVYASWDRGAHWTSLDTDLPPVPVYDLVYQAGGNDLVLGTHGRGIWILDDSRPLTAMTATVAAEPLHLFPPAEAMVRPLYTPQAWFGAGEFFATNPPAGAPINFYLAAKPDGQARITIHDAAGATVREFTAAAHAGMNQAVWDLRRSPALAALPGGRGGGGRGGRGGGAGPLVEPGNYSVSLQVGNDAAQTAPLIVVANLALGVTPEARRARAQAIASAYDLEQQLGPALKAAADAGQQIAAIQQYLEALGSNADPKASAALRTARSAQASASAGLTRIATAAAGAERAADGYSGAPTAAQLADLNHAWQDAPAAVTAVNQVVQRDLPALVTALGGKQAWPAITAAAVPKRH